MTTPEQPDRPKSIQEEREEAISALERSVRRRRVGIRWTTALFAMALGVLGLWWMWPDLSYFFSPREPITLGTEGDYHFDRLATNRYAQIHGIPTLKGAFSREDDATLVHVGLQGTPVIVRRGSLPTEDWVPGRPPTTPDQRPFGIRGRLLSEDDAGRYKQAFQILRDEEGVVPRDGKLWILVEGEKPGALTFAFAMSLFLVLFIAVNAYFFVRDLKGRFRA